MITTVSQLERTTADDVVTTAHWNASEVDGDYSASAYGSQSFTRDSDSPTLVPFADLTEATVVGWLTLDEGLEANLLAQIAEQKAPTAASGVPW
tara:strand:+ start:1735 stop:2016 length:282 start_codon:yes stop_codon:yes gene_type:complete